MMHEAFLHDILEHPDDDGPRLVYADWLDENGESERAEFIRIQYALASLDAEDPRHADLTERQSDLLEAHKKGWRASLPELDGVTWGDFRRGFVAKAEVTNFRAFRTHSQTLFAAAPIEEIYFRKLTPNTAGQLARSPLLARLRRLTLWSSGAGPDGLEALLRSPYLTELVSLTLEHEEIGPGVLAALGEVRLDGLTHLALERNHLGDDGVKALAESLHFPRLESLSLSRNELGDAGAASLAGSPGLAKVRSLNLYDNVIGSAGAAALAES
jgi:uncharacterized protein (TIGR02996 family)